MPRVYDVDDEIKESTRSCGNIADDLKYCIMTSDCVQKDKKLPSECFKENLLSEECYNLRTLLFECKRSLVSNNIFTFLSFPFVLSLCHSDRRE